MSSRQRESILFTPNDFDNVLLGRETGPHSTSRSGYVSTKFNGNIEDAPEARPARHGVVFFGMLKNQCQ